MGIYIKNFTKEDLTEMLYAVPLRYKVPEEGDIIEVAEPHGALKDIEVLFQEIREAYGEGVFSMESIKGSLFGHTVMNAPTVIESEE